MNIADYENITKSLLLKSRTMRFGNNIAEFRFFRIHALDIKNHEAMM